MVDGQIHTAGVVSPAILEAFSSIPRELFVPEKYKSIAYTDTNLDLGQGRVLLSPVVYSRMLEYAETKPCDVALDIASASGYSSVILSSLVGTVIALEKNKRQKDKAERLIQNLNICNVFQVDGEIEEGAAEHAPYSLILINGAVSHVPDPLLEQLSKDGRLIAPVISAESCVRVTMFRKSDNGSVSSKILFDTAVPELSEFAARPEFVF